MSDRIYVTMPQSPTTHQMTLDELFSGKDFSRYIRSNAENTRTDVYPRSEMMRIAGERLKRGRSKYDTEDWPGWLAAANASLENFNRKYNWLADKPRESLYHSYFIPKQSGGLRRIDEPGPELRPALDELVTLFNCVFGAAGLYHTSAFAYITKRSTRECVKRHVDAGMRWRLKLDCHGFFPSTTQPFVEKQLSMVFPFCLFHEYGNWDEMHRALSLCFLNGGLPQGSPISPMLTNIMMIPIDHIIANNLRDFKEVRKNLTYTRYADDIYVSCKYHFDWRTVKSYIEGILKAFDAPFYLNNSKTNYANVSNGTWMLGIMVTPDPHNKDKLMMTVGRAKKKRLESMLMAYARDKRRGLRWELADIQELAGFCSYVRMIEGGVCDRIVKHMSQKCGLDIPASIKRDLKAGA